MANDTEMSACNTEVFGFTRLLDRDSIYDCLFGHCTPATIFRLGRTCKIARRSVQDYAERVFDIEKFLSHFFTDPFGFRVLQAQTQLIIAGSSALQFMDRTRYAASDLDVYVSAPHFVEVCRWIMDFGGKGYEHQKSSCQRNEDVEASFARVLLQNSNVGTTMEDTNHEINMFETDGFHDYKWNHIQEIFDFHSTTHGTAYPLRIQQASATASSTVEDMEMDLDFVEECYSNRILDRDGIYDCLFGYCTPATIFCLGRTCRLAYRSVQDYMKRAFDIEKHFSRYFTNPFTFRILQARTQALVSGSTALQFMDRTLYEESDLDIYVSWPQAAKVCEWIMNWGGKGYEYFVPKDPDSTETYESYLEKVAEEVANLHIPSSEDIDTVVSNLPPLLLEYGWNNIHWVFNFRSTTHAGVDPLHIQVIVTVRSPADSIFTFHSTVVLNVITYRAAYSLYPKGSFEERRSLICRAKGQRYEKAIEKYENRGWKMDTTPITNREQMDLDSSFRLENRWVGDRKTWVIPFDMSQVRLYINPTHRPFLLSIDPFTLNSFSVMNGPTDTPIQIDYCLLKPSFFEYRYTACYEFSAMMKFWFAIIHRYERPSKMRKFDSFLVKLKRDFVQNCEQLSDMS
ncbi:hypothetical protein M0805_003303 [Coniferiporia weirii]|nr:hypothetical protein M0805_003303 [Coniferiporia weirii]